MHEPICVGCNKRPEEIQEYIDSASEFWSDSGDGMTPSEYVIEDEGTYNPENGHFLCTACYIDWNCPSSPTGWKAP